MVLVDFTDVVVMLTLTVRLDRSVTPQILMEMGTNMSVLMILVVTTMTRTVLDSMLCVTFLLMKTASFVLGKNARMAVSTTTTVLRHIQCVVMVLVELTDVVVMLTLTVRLDRSVTPQILMEMGTNMSVLMMLVVTTMTRTVLDSIPPAKLISQHLNIANASIAVGRTANLAVLTPQCVQLVSQSVATVGPPTTVAALKTLTVWMFPARIGATLKLTSARHPQGNSPWTRSDCTVSPALGAPVRGWWSLSWVWSTVPM